MSSNSLRNASARVLGLAEEVRVGAGFGEPKAFGAPPTTGDLVFFSSSISARKLSKKSKSSSACRALGKILCNGRILYLGFLSLLKQVRMCSRWGCRKTPAARRAGRSRLPSSRTSINLSVCLNCNYPSTNKVRKRKAVTRKDYFTHDDYPVSARLWFVISFSGVVEVFRVAYSCSYRRVCQKLSVCSRVLGRKSRKF